MIFLNLIYFCGNLSAPYHEDTENREFASMPTFSLIVVTQDVIATAFGATSDGKTGIMTHDKVIKCGNTFRVTGPLCGEFTSHRWIPHTKASDAELGCFLWSPPNKRLSKQSWGWWFEMPSCPLWRHCNDSRFSGTHLPVYFLDISILHLLIPWYLLTPTTNWHAWKRFSHYWPFVRGIHRSPMNSFQKGLVIRNSDIDWY